MKMKKTKIKALVGLAVMLLLVQGAGYHVAHQLSHAFSGKNVTKVTKAGN
ncbi:hypothetical protein GCM10027182_09460 [Aquaspirillum soli]